MMMAAINPQAPTLGSAYPHEFRRDGDESEVEADKRCRGQRVSHAALEDEVRIHQPVTNDRPAEGKRQKDHRDTRQLGHHVGHGSIRQVGDREQQRVRRDRDNGAAREPLELLAAQRRGRSAGSSQTE